MFAIVAAVLHFLVILIVVQVYRFRIALCSYDRCLFWPDRGPLKHNGVVLVPSSFPYGDIFVFILGPGDNLELIDHNIIFNSRRLFRHPVSELQNAYLSLADHRGYFKELLLGIDLFVPKLTIKAIII